MDGGTNVVDRSTNHIDGTLENFPTNAFGPGLFSNALNFSSNETVNFPVKPALQMGGGFTFSAWVKAVNSATNAMTVATWADASTNSWAVGITDVTMNVQTSSDLQTWTTVSNPVIVQTTDSRGNPIMQVQVPQNGTVQFIRWVLAPAGS